MNQELRFHDGGKSPWPMISVDEALELVHAHTRRLEPSSVPLLESLGCVLTEDVVAGHPHPHFRASIMDGFAVVSSDGPGVYPVVGDCLAGPGPSGGPLRIQPGQVAYITTGAALPEGADAVVPIEECSPAGRAEDGSAATAATPASPGQDLVRIGLQARPGLWVREVGSDIPGGSVVLAAGTRIGATEVGLLASLGRRRVPVVRNPVVGVLSTGDELLDPLAPVDAGGVSGPDSQGDPAHVALGPGQIWDSNRPMLLALLRELPASPLDLGVVMDRETGLRERVMAALPRCDILVVTGGVSMGSSDLLKPLLHSLGRVHFGRLCMKPGKPTTFATIDLELDAGANPDHHADLGAEHSRPPGVAGPGSARDPDRPRGQRRVLVFALPGNPVSAQVCFRLLAEPAIRKLAGQGAWDDADRAADAATLLPCVPARLAQGIHLDAARPEYHRALVFWDAERNTFSAVSGGEQRSSRLRGTPGCNALLRLPRAEGVAPAGSTVDALLVGPIPANNRSLCEALGRLEQAPPVRQAPGCGHSHGSGIGPSASHGHGHDPAQPRPPAPLAPALPSPPPAAAPLPPPANAQRPRQLIRIAALTVSDRVAAGLMEDRSIPSLDAFLELAADRFPGVELRRISAEVVSDERGAIEHALIRLCEGPAAADGQSPVAGDAAELVLTLGGTGFAPRDVTPEATAAVIERQAPGLVQLINQVGLQATPMAALSRLTAGIRGRSIIVNLPGSPKAIGEIMPALLGILPHAIRLLRGEERGGHP